MKLPSRLIRFYIRLDVVLSGNGIKDEVEATPMLAHLIGIAGYDNFVSTREEGVSPRVRSRPRSPRREVLPIGAALPLWSINLSGSMGELIRPNWP